MKKLLSLLAGFSVSSSLFAQSSESAPAAQGGGMMQTVVMIAVALVFFYFILWRPEQKRRKQMEQIRTSMKKGDRITAMGIVGTVVKVLDNSVVISLYDGAQMEVLKQAITDVQPAGEKSEKSVEANESR